MKKIAVTYENGAVFQHFGHTAQFKVYDIENGQVVSSAVVSTNGSGHGALADILKGYSVDTLICGGIGGGAKQALQQSGISFFCGVTGSADDAVKNLLAGNLNHNPDTLCNHHHEGGHGHQCGSHHGGQCGGGHCHG